MPLKQGSTIYLPPKDLYSLDQADRALIKKASYRKAKRSVVSSGKKKGAATAGKSTKSRKARKA